MERRSFLRLFLGAAPAAVAIQPAGEGLFGLLSMAWRKVFPKKPLQAPFIGRIPIRQDITVLPADPKTLKLGWVIYEEVGITIVNDYAVARLTLDGPVTQR